MMKKKIEKKMCLKKNLLFFWGMLVIFCVAGIAQAAQPPQPPQLPVRPPSRFREVEGSNGSIVRDTNTGLEWQRCAYGESWTGSGCSGIPWKGSWDDAVKLTASGGFHLPTLDELKSLDPYDQSIFPGAYWFWSSSLDANSIHAWGINWGHFNSVYGYRKSNDGQARLVRAGK